LAAALLGDTVLRNLSTASQGFQGHMQSNFSQILSDNDFTGIFLTDAMHRPVYSAGQDFSLSSDMEILMKEAFETRKRIAKFSGTTWGVFWYQRKTLMLAAPVQDGNRYYAGIGIQMDLAPIYADQRHSQRFVCFYLAINTLILTFIGFYRLSNVYLEPINRLVRIAEDYQEADGTFFPVRKQDNELGKLSKALNMMIRRISEDKKTLRSTVDSLETTNLELQKAQGEIIRAEKLASIGRLSSGIAHEIGNPIGIVMGYLDLIKQENIPLHEKTDFIQRIEKEIHRMDTVIRQLLDLSRPYASATEIISVHDAIHDMKHVFSVQPLTSHIQVDLSLNAESDRVRADVNQLRQVFLNLAINAADAIAAGDTPREGRLEIKTEVGTDDATHENKPSRRLKITFIDNGPGIPAEYLGNIFDPFFTTKEPGKGTGLGLSVCFMIVDAMDGSISAESEPGNGTAMTIRLPLAD